MRLYPTIAMYGDYELFIMNTKMYASIEMGISFENKIRPIFVISRQVLGLTAPFAQKATCTKSTYGQINLAVQQPFCVTCKS